MPLNPPKCPACQGPKNARLYVCPGCWFTLPRAARAALNRRDARAAARLIELHRQLDRNVPLHEIRITP